MTWEILSKRKQMVIPAKFVLPIWQGCPLTLGTITLKQVLTQIKDLLQQATGYFNSKIGLRSMLGLNLQDSHPIGEILFESNKCGTSHTLPTATTGSKYSQIQPNNQTNSKFKQENSAMLCAS